MVRNIKLEEIETGNGMNRDIDGLRCRKTERIIVRVKESLLE